VFEEIGGEVTINKLVDDFYEIMSTDPVAYDCLKSHAGKDLSESAHKLKYFLSGWLGGPQLYLENFGHPRLRIRHNPFPIGIKEAEQWMYCMKLAMKKSSIPLPLQDQMYETFLQVAQMLIKNHL
jgi:hemoglobin